MVVVNTNKTAIDPERRQAHTAIYVNFQVAYTLKYIFWTACQLLSDAIRYMHSAKRKRKEMQPQQQQCVKIWML